ncbi:hypothetical protein ABL78_5963 [Leptomonas seymouri]|uniref:Uncharacterized protein n=1 Tax=Leptomonas seymouri TaxID=5684 RepID=A0A0N0P4M5_LEPSE|nr:hypothetical protein ABL78_5963 [Leptomonas seymouri]|eukprot:KPI84997.1 hypothetical protein ABL78_5963 [Leptomonas seymouri]
MPAVVTDRTLLPCAHLQYAIHDVFLSHAAPSGPLPQKEGELRLALEVLGLSVKPMHCTVKFCAANASTR